MFPLETVKTGNWLIPMKRDKTPPKECLSVLSVAVSDSSLMLVFARTECEGVLIKSNECKRLRFVWCGWRWSSQIELLEGGGLENYTWPGLSVVH